jgi:hypothetical protein
MPATTFVDEELMQRYVDRRMEQINLEQYLARLGEFLECTIEHLEGEHKGKVVVSLDVFNALYDAAHDIAAPLLREEIEGNSKTVPCEATGAVCLKMDEALNMPELPMLEADRLGNKKQYKAAIQAAPSILQELIEGE